MRIGIILTGDYSWAGGLYYSLNIIKSLQEIANGRDLRVVAIINASTPKNLLAELPATVEIANLDTKSLFYKLFYKVLGGRFEADINRLKLDVLYPMIAFQPSHSRLNCKVLYWLYDFQHKFLPELFSEEELKRRDRTFSDIARYGKDIVFSSQDSKHHFEQFFPDSKAKKHVYNFVSLPERGDETKPPDFSLPSKYFIVCNQFWPHKNHKVVLKAINELVKQNVAVHVVFTGKNDDQRSKQYVDDLQKYIHEHQLKDHVTLTGFISRADQLNLMRHSIAVIQPSLFEGWSTVVEDAKALNQFVLAGDIAVNREQIEKNVAFFEPQEHLLLTSLMKRMINGDISGSPVNYAENIARSKEVLIDLFKIQ